MAKINKKGVLLSTISLVFLLLLVAIAQIGNQYDSFAKNEISKTIQIQRGVYLRSDIAQNILTILDIEIYERGEHHITFNKLSKIGDTQYTQRISEYLSFIENDFAPRLNTNISFSGVIPSYSLYPVLVATINPNNHTFYLENVTKINLTIFAEYELLDALLPLDQNSEDPEIIVIIRNSTDQETYQRNLDITEFHEFNWEFQEGNLSLIINNQGINILTEGIEVTLEESTFNFSTPIKFMKLSGIMNHKEFNSSIILN